MTLHFPRPRIRRRPGAHTEPGQTQRLQARVDDLTKQLDRQTAINADISRRLRALEARDANAHSMSELPQHISTVASPQARPEPVSWGVCVRPLHQAPFAHGGGGRGRRADAAGRPAARLGRGRRGGGVTMDDVVRTLRTAADLTLTHGPDPVGCIRAAIYGDPNAVLPFEDTYDSLLAEDSEYRLQYHLNPGSSDAADDTTCDEWAAGRSVADVRTALLATADELEAVTR
ncbi:hypothetical protein [Streptomyces phytophilus]|uniref:hypothetical protein n=1 Tax=Streptomyces phytophilus TaxID=722715 RepID=UPI0015F04721|nr:hypothetical protein [Streptomyces phytophilus]